MTAEGRSRPGGDVERPLGLEKIPPEYHSDVVVETLRGLGYRYIPLTPGSSFRGLHDSLVNFGANADPQMLLCLHEEVAVSLAHGYAKATGTTCPVVLHDLVGVMHGSMAVYNAYCDRVPLVVLGGSGPAELAHRRPIEWLHSATTQAELVRDFVKWDDEPSGIDGVVSSLCRAHQISSSAPTGPTYVSIDMGEQEHPYDGTAVPDVAAYAPAPPIAPDPMVVQRAVELLAGARLPVIVGGRVGLSPSASAPIAELVERLGAAYRDDQHFVCLASDHPQNLTGDTSLVGDADVVLLIDVADPQVVVPTGTQPLVIDCSLGDLGLRSWSNAFGAPLRRDVHLLADPLSSVRALVAALDGAVDERVATARREQVRGRGVRLRAELAARLAAHHDDAPISGPRLDLELFKALDGVDWLLTMRNGRSWYEGAWRFTGSGQFLGHSGGGGVGYGPGAAVGAAIAAAERGQLGVAIVGDGDLLMANSALWTAAHYQVPMLMVVNDNRSFFNDEAHQMRLARARGRALDNATIGVRIDGPAVDFVGMARAFGCYANGPVADPSELPHAFAEALAVARGGAPALVHVLTAPAEY